MTAMPPAQLLKGAAVAGLLAAWAVAAHYGSAGGGNPDLNALLGIIPLVATGALLLWRVGHPLLSALGSLAALALLAWLWPRLRENIPLLYYLQHLGVHLALGTLFGRTLLGPGEALITRFARILYPQGISPRKARYTRQVTVAWTCFFFGNALVSTLLFWLAPPALWSLHANLLTGPLIALMFLAEHFWRMGVLPPEERPSIAMAIRAYREGMQKNASPASQP